MSTNNTTPDEVLSQVQEILAEMTGNDIAEIGPQALLEDELGVTPVDFSRIIAKLNTQFDINLDARELMDEEISAVKELAMIVREEAELG